MSSQSWLLECELFFQWKDILHISTTTIIKDTGGVSARYASLGQTSDGSFWSASTLAVFPIEGCHSLNISCPLLDFGKDSQSALCLELGTPSSQLSLYTPAICPEFNRVSPELSQFLLTNDKRRLPLQPCVNYNDVKAWICSGSASCMIAGAGVFCWEHRQHQVCYKNCFCNLSGPTKHCEAWRGENLTTRPRFRVSSVNLSSLSAKQPDSSKHSSGILASSGNLMHCVALEVGWCCWDESFSRACWL